MVPGALGLMNKEALQKTPCHSGRSFFEIEFSHMLELLVPGVLIMRTRVCGVHVLVPKFGDSQLG